MVSGSRLVVWGNAGPPQKTLEYPGISVLAFLQLNRYKFWLSLGFLSQVRFPHRLSEMSFESRD